MILNFFCARWIMVEDLALIILALCPKEIWKQVYNEMNTRISTLDGLCVIKMVCNVQTKAHMLDFFYLVEIPHLRRFLDRYWYRCFHIMLFDEESDYGRNSEDNYHVNGRLHHLLHEQLYQVQSGSQ